MLTETWLSPITSDNDLLLPNIGLPYRKDRVDRVDRGITVYIKSSLSKHKRTNLIDNAEESLSIEVKVSGSTSFCYAEFIDRRTPAMNIGIQ